MVEELIILFKQGCSIFNKFVQYLTNLFNFRVSCSCQCCSHCFFFYKLVLSHSHLLFAVESLSSYYIDEAKHSLDGNNPASTKRRRRLVEVLRAILGLEGGAPALLKKELSTMFNNLSEDRKL